MSDTPPPPPASSAPSGSPAPSSNASFFSRMFDMSFTEYITPSIIKIIFIIGLIFSGLMALVVFVAFASQGGATIIVGIILAPLVFFMYALMARVMSELYLILFRIEENTRKD